MKPPAAYDPVPFWANLAPYIAGPGAVSPEHVRQEAALETLLRRLTWSSVFEVGIGGGRISDLLRRVRPKAEYAGIDLGQVQLDAGRRIWPDGTFELGPIEDFVTDRQWDLVIASEVLMYVVPERIDAAIGNILRMAKRHIVIVEWVPLPGELDQPVAEWNFPHDYPSRIGSGPSYRTDRQVIFHRDMHYIQSVMHNLSSGAWK